MEGLWWIHSHSNLDQDTLITDSSLLRSYSRYPTSPSTHSLKNSIERPVPQIQPSFNLTNTNQTHHSMSIFPGGLKFPPDRAVKAPIERSKCVGSQIGKSGHVSATKAVLSSSLVRIITTSPTPNPKRPNIKQSTKDWNHIHSIPNPVIIIPTTNISNCHSSPTMLIETIVIVERCNHGDGDDVVVVLVLC